ncbi:MAG: hypothetical protein QXH27_01995 [Candidatus Micrarchaeia archaeon]
MGETSRKKKGKGRAAEAAEPARAEIPSEAPAETGEAEPAPPAQAEMPAEARPGEMRTVIDRVVEFIKEKKRATVAEVAEALALERDDVEKLADILEESGLVSVRYSLLHPGKTELIIRERAPAPAKKELAGLSEMLESLDSDVRASEKRFLSVEDDILTRLRRAEETLEALEEAEKGASPEEAARLVREGEALEGVLADFDRKVDVLERRIEGFKRRIAVFKARSASLGRKGPLARLAGFFDRMARVIARSVFRRG